MFVIPQGVDPKVKKVLQDIQAILYRLDKRRVRSTGDIVNMFGGRSGGGTAVTVQSSPGISPGTILPGQTINGNLSINGVLLVNGVPPLYSEQNLLDPSVTDVSGSRVMGTVYQNTESTMKRVDVCVKHA